MRLINKDISKPITVKLNRSYKDDVSSGIMTYGEKNDYPQTIEKIIYNSQTAKACAKIYAKFLSGEGFEIEGLGLQIVGKDFRGNPITLNKIVRQITQSIAFFNGVFIHCNINRNSEIGDTSVLPFKNCRFSTKDDTGYCSRIAVNPNWTNDNDSKSLVQWFNSFNLDREVVASQFKKYGKKHNGQVYSALFDDNYLYPLSPFDSVYLDCDTENQIQIFKNNQIRNGFTDKIFLRVPNFQNEDDEKEFNKKVETWLGADGDNAIVVTDEVDENGELKKSGFEIVNVKTSINDKLFENWEKSLANNIRKAINALPAVLIDYEEGKLSSTSGESIIQAVSYYNSLTKDMRMAISEILKDIYSYSANPILKNNTNWNLKPLNLL